MESLRAYNLKLVANILPLNVAEHFLKKQVNKEEVIFFAFLPSLTQTSENGVAYFRKFSKGVKKLSKI